MNQSAKKRPVSRSKSLSEATRRLPLDFNPTFPLDADEIRNVRATLIGKTPRLMVWQLLGQAGAQFGLFSRFTQSWQEIEPRLSNAVIEHVIKQSNASQNQVVYSLVLALEQARCNSHAETIRKFLWTKQAIETALTTNRRLAPQRVDVEVLVDSILQEVCSEVLLLADLQFERSEMTKSKADAEATADLDRRISELQSRISRAYDSLRETEKQMTFAQVDRQQESSPSHGSPVLDELIDALAEENEIARVVNVRVDEELTHLT